jgi:hypothetical protein
MISFTEVRARTSRPHRWRLNTLNLIIACTHTDGQYRLAPPKTWNDDDKTYEGFRLVARAVFRSNIHFFFLL